LCGPREVRLPASDEASRGQLGGRGDHVGRVNCISISISISTKPTNPRSWRAGANRAD